MKSTVWTLVIVGIIALVAGPLVLIWEINTLFPVLDVQYTLDTWAGAAFIMSVFGNFGKTSK